MSKFIDMKIVLLGTLVALLSGCGGDSAEQKAADDEAYVRKRVQMLIDGKPDDPKILDDFPDGSKISSLTIKDQSEEHQVEAVIMRPDGSQITVYGEYNGDTTLPITFTYTTNSLKEAETP